jgi:SNF2 family DNA or RNA helicase
MSATNTTITHPDINIISITEFMQTFASQLEKKIEERLSPIYNPQNIDNNFGSQLKPFPIQREIVKALAAGYKNKKALFLVGEMGCGKTAQGVWASEMLKSKRTLVVCPPHLIQQWREEILKCYPHKKVAIIPNPQLKKLSISNMTALQAIHKDGNIDFVVISREAIKTDFPIKSNLILRRIGNNKYKDEACPYCFEPVSYDTKLKLRKNTKVLCEKCKSPLYSYIRHGNKARPSLAKYIQKKMKGFFKFIIFDEAHELKAEDSAQGAVLGKLAGKAKTLAMTGTLMGGKASDIFFLLQRTNPKDMKSEGFIGKKPNVSAFVEKYGVLEKTVKAEDQDNKYSIGKKRTQENLKERPGLSPLVVGNFLLDKTAFVRLSDFAEKLPLYIEHPVECETHPEAAVGYAILSSYQNVLRSANRPAKIISSAIQAMLAYPDTHSEEIICDIDENFQEVPLLIAPEAETLIGETDKEQQLLKIVKEAKNNGDKVLIFTTQTKKRDIQPKIAKLLEIHNIKPAVMYNHITTDKRDAWIKNKTKNIDALICHPRLVATGMNLLEYPIIIFFDTGYSTYTLRQASRRSYRINQTKPQVDVYYLYTKDTIQQDCLSLMAKKNEVSLMAEGEIQEGGLSAMSNGAGSILNELVKVINGELKTENPLEIFSRTNKLNNEGKIKAEIKPIATETALPKIHIPRSDYLINIHTPGPIQIGLF